MYLENIIGQEKNKIILQTMIEAAKLRKEQLGHILICGAESSGRKVLARAIAGEANMN